MPQVQHAQRQMSSDDVFDLMHAVSDSITRRARIEVDRQEVKAWLSEFLKKNNVALEE